MGYVYCLLAVIGFTVLGISYKLCDRYECDRRHVNLSFFASGGAIALVWAIVAGTRSHLAQAVVLGAVAGMVTFFGVIAFRQATSKGRLSTAWTVVNLPAILPVLASILIWHEIPSIRHYAGFALTLVAIVLIGIDVGRARE